MPNAKVFRCLARNPAFHEIWMRMIYLQASLEFQWLVYPLSLRFLWLRLRDSWSTIQVKPVSQPCGGIIGFTSFKEHHELDYIARRFPFSACRTALRPAFEIILDDVYRE